MKIQKNTSPPFCTKLSLVGFLCANNTDVHTWLHTISVERSFIALPRRVNCRYRDVIIIQHAPPTDCLTYWHELRRWWALVGSTSVCLSFYLGSWNMMRRRLMTRCASCLLHSVPSTSGKLWNGVSKLSAVNSCWYSAGVTTVSEYGPFASM